MDRIEPIRPRTTPDPVPGVRRTESSTDKRERDGSGRRPPQRRAPAPPPPPDDGLPHIDVTV